MVSLIPFPPPTCPQRGDKCGRGRNKQVWEWKQIKVRGWKPPTLSSPKSQLQNHGPGCPTWCLYEAAHSPVGIPCSPPCAPSPSSPYAHLRLVSTPLLSAPCLTMGLDIPLLPPPSLFKAPCTRFAMDKKRVVARQVRDAHPPGGQEEGETMGCRCSRGGESGTWPAELLRAVGGFENVFTRWTHFNSQNSVFLAALIFSLKFYLTVFEIGQCSNLAALMWRREGCSFCAT